jgi:hypothetical protein
MDLRLILKTVMSSLLNKIKNQQTDSPTLTQQEIEFLLYMIKEVSFKGENVELLYSVVSKLQKQYLAQTKDK